MELNLKLVKENIIPKLNVNTAEEVIDALGNTLVKNGNVKDEYISAIKEREKTYPTGLPSTSPGIAIPHANNELVIETTVAVATLERPVKFKNMEDKDEEVEVQIVFMLAIAEPHGQIEMLQKVVEIIQNEEYRKELLTYDDSEKLLEKIKEILY